MGNATASQAQKPVFDLAERTAKLRQTIAELEAFSYSLSHDMRAPLRSIQAFTQLALDESQPKIGPEAACYLQKVIAAAPAGAGYSSVFECPARTEETATPVIRYLRVFTGPYL